MLLSPVSFTHTKGSQTVLAGPRYHACTNHRNGIYCARQSVFQLAVSLGTPVLPIRVSTLHPMGFVPIGLTNSYSRFVGAPIASAVSFTLMAFVSVGYAYLFVPKRAWHPIGPKTFHELGTLYKLGLWGTGQIASEWWSWEFLGLMSSR